MLNKIALAVLIRAGVCNNMLVYDENAPSGVVTPKLIKYMREAFELNGFICDVDDFASVSSAVFAEYGETKQPTIVGVDYSHMIRLFEANKATIQSYDKKFLIGVNTNRCETEDVKSAVLLGSY